ncbi:AtpZ/AtpI family protein [Magnetospirillum sp. UT-4]|uniref:AtpZ/AtpI family protein n=1 Tax=Magnetospirillum sp. UT-4 TaxID=2681467 RepID=UPI0013852603|nr:AtpZ/AtpI family protein [Magnetospirillum sp. UT-4]CAA7622932.1 ATP synthase protein I [Magnetospirillum sp. UT-4]
MAEQELPPNLDELEERLRAARARESEENGPKSAGRHSLSGLGQGMRLAVEFVVGVVVGAGIGWGLDRWFGTQPWMMVLFLVFGTASGVMNAYRAARRMDDTVGFAAAQKRADEADRDK